MIKGRTPVRGWLQTLVKDGDDIRSLVVAVSDGCVVIAMVWVTLALAMLRDWQLRGGSDSAGSVGSEE